MLKQSNNRKEQESKKLAADEHCAMDYIHKEPHEMDEQEKRELEAAIWRACWTLMITFDEAKAAVAKYCQ